MSCSYALFLRIILFVLVSSIANLSVAAGDESPAPVGNFALPTALQPGPFVTLGQEILDKNQWQFSLGYNYLNFQNQTQRIILPQVIYAFTDSFTVMVNTPIAYHNHAGPYYSSGFQDSTVQLEYAFYNKSFKAYTQQATIVAGLTLPTGSDTKQPSTGIGGLSYLFAGTLNRMYNDWYFFTSDGVLITDSHSATHYGIQYLYQGGLGRNIWGNKDKDILFALVEFSGDYQKANKVAGTYDPNSGGNMIFMTPSLWYSTPRWVYQLGIGIPIVQHQRGSQNKANYYIVANIGLTLG